MSNTEKKIVNEEILRIRKRGSLAKFYGKDLLERNIEIKPDDIINIYRDNEGDSEEHTATLYVYRPRPETDEEQQKRLNRQKAFKAYNNKNQYETYLKLKETFGKLSEEEIKEIETSNPPYPKIDYTNYAD